MMKHRIRSWTVKEHIEDTFSLSEEKEDNNPSLSKNLERWCFWPWLQECTQVHNHKDVWIDKRIHLEAVRKLRFQTGDSSTNLPVVMEATSFLSPSRETHCSREVHCGYKLPPYVKREGKRRRGKLKQREKIRKDNWAIATQIIPNSQLSKILIGEWFYWGCKLQYS